MDAAFGWLNEMVRWLARFVPRPILIRKTHRAILFTRARAREVGPGLRVYWPLVTEVEVEAVAGQILRVPCEPMVTAEGQTVVAGAVIEYTVASLTKLYVDNYDALDNAIDLASAGLRRTVAGANLTTLQQEHGKIDRRLRANMRRELEPLGIDVRRARVRALAPAQVLVLVQSATAEVTG